MKNKPFQRVDKVIQNCDIVLEVVDSRFPGTRSKSIERKVKRKRKKLIIVFNKSELISRAEKRELAKKTGKIPYVFMSAKKRFGRDKLKEKIFTLCSWPEARVGLIGYPNTGKSSLINYISGRKVVGTSSRPNFTKGEQWIRATKRLLLSDTPGVIPGYQKEDKLAEKGAFDADLMKDPVPLAWSLLENEGARDFYELSEEGPEALNELAEKRGRLKKGGEPNLNSVAKMVIRDFQKGSWK